MSFFYHKGWIDISQVEDIGNVVSIGHNQSNQEYVFGVKYDSQDTFNNATVENIYTQTGVDVDIIKIDKIDGEKLPGAVFTLKEIDGTKVPTEGGTPIYKQDGQGVLSTDSDPTAETTGQTSFEGLTAGYYEITEKEPPDGYIQATDLAIYFKIRKGKVTWLVKDPTKKPSEWAAVTDEVNEWVTFEAEKDETNAAFTVKNEPGVELPSTGGPGTHMFYRIGALLTMLGAGMIMFRNPKT